MTLVLLSGVSRAELTFETHGDFAMYDATQLAIQGKGWENTFESYTRLPAAAKESVPAAVWNLARHSAGLFVRFRTDANQIKVVHQVTGSLTMPHMTTVGSSGLDLYCQDPKGTWRWVGISKPNAHCYTNTILQGISKELRDYTLYLPLYNHTASLTIGVPVGSKFEAIAPAPTKPIVYYGTSIAHGCSASRPGMVYTAILGRRLDRTFINLGFSGNGRMEETLADYLAEIDAAIYVLDCVPNMSPEQVTQRAAIFIKRLRQVRPTVPIVMVAGRPFTNSWLKPDNSAAKNSAYRTAFDQLISDGIQKLSYVDGTDLFGTDNEGAIDGSHPNDLGMWHQADILTPILKELL